MAAQLDEDPVFRCQLCFERVEGRDQRSWVTLDQLDLAVCCWCQQALIDRLHESERVWES